jgi:hypothetical protein
MLIFVQEIHVWISKYVCFCHRKESRFMKLKVTVRKRNTDSASYCGGGCNGCSCGRSGNGIIPPAKSKKP